MNHNPEIIEEMVLKIGAMLKSLILYIDCGLIGMGLTSSASVILAYLKTDVSNLTLFHI
jgi:mevalonate kinase